MAAKKLMGKRKAPKALATLDLNSVMYKALTSKKSEGKIQKAVYQEANRKAHETYEAFYKALVLQILRYFQQGFRFRADPDWLEASRTKEANADIKASTKRGRGRPKKAKELKQGRKLQPVVAAKFPGGGGDSFRPSWEPLTPGYLRQKAGLRANKIKRRRAMDTASTYGSITKRKEIKPTLSDNRFWVFRRNLYQGAKAHGFTAAAATVTLTEKDVTTGKVVGKKIVKVTTREVLKDLAGEARVARNKRGTGLGYGKRALFASGPNRRGKDSSRKFTSRVVRSGETITIPYIAGLTFSTLPTPMNELVRKPFILGDGVKVEVYDRGAGSSAKHGIRVVALVEGQRPFIVELSALMGRKARQRLKIKP